MGVANNRLLTADSQPLQAELPYRLQQPEACLRAGTGNALDQTLLDERGEQIEDGGSAATGTP